MTDQINPALLTLMTIDPDAPAFAHPAAYGDYGRFTDAQPGISTRTYLAGLAMQGLLAHCGDHRGATHDADAVRWADRLIAALNQSTT